MNKPNKENYIMDGRLISSVYMMVLEEYVEDLEQRLCNSDFNLQCLDKDITKLEKALDKACKYVNDIHSCPLDTFGFEAEGGCDSVCLERMEDSSLCWKEWAMKDD